MRKLRIGALAVLGLTALACGLYIVRELRVYPESDRIYETIRQESFRIPEPYTPPAAEGETVTQAPTEALLCPVDFGTLQAMNADVVGWIYLPDTALSYPLLQGGSNEDYLRTTPTGEHNITGSIFLEYRCFADFSGLNTVIYGHRIKNDKMFGGLEHYLTDGYLEQHPYIYVFTPQSRLTYAVFAAYTTTANSDTYIIDFQSRDSYGVYLQRILEWSDVQSALTPTPDHRILTLSTCTILNNSQRTVVHAMLIETADWT